MVWTTKPQIDFLTEWKPRFREVRSKGALVDFWPPLYLNWKEKGWVLDDDEKRTRTVSTLQ